MENLLKKEPWKLFCGLWTLWWRPQNPRKALRIGLVGLSFGLGNPAWAWPLGDPTPQPSSQDLAARASELLAGAIRIRTVNPPGDEYPLARYFVKTLEREGIEARVVETPSVGSRQRRALAWARVAGTGAQRPILLLSHLDVVPAEPTQWVFPPFAGSMTDGYVVGRGALDAKGISVVHLLALRELAQRSKRLTRDVIFLATPDEETGGQQGAGFLVRERPDLLHNAEFLLTEGGNVLVGEPNIPPLWGVAVNEKTPCWLQLVARGIPGHSATEPRNAAVPRLIRALERVRLLETELRVLPEVARMFARLAPWALPEDRVPLHDLAQALTSDPLFRSRFLNDRGHNALVRNTIAITVLHGSAQTNVIPAEASAHLDARLLPGERCQNFAELIRSVIDDDGIAIETNLEFSAQGSPWDTVLSQAIERVAAEMEPDAVVVPRVIAGFTDAHYFRERGIVAYGFVPRWLTPNDTRGIHGANERIASENLERGVRTLTRILEVLGTPEN